MFEQEYFQNDDAARDHIESILWPEGPVCPHCGCVGHITKMAGKTTRPGAYKCNDCRKPFTVTVGTILERSHIGLHVWLQAFYLMCASKKGMSSHQMHRMLGVTYKTAWFMEHHIREAMHDDMPSILGGDGEIVEVDETYWGNIPGEEVHRGYQHKEKIVSLVERNGSARSFHVERVNAATLKPMLKEHIAQQTRIMTHQAAYYKGLDAHFAEHQTVNHIMNEYARGDVTTNTVEGFFSILKRGLIGTYHHVGAAHLPAYLSEFDFRYNTRDTTDLERTVVAMRGISGKRLVYRGSAVLTA
jgi:transposase-like protein